VLVVKVEILVTRALPVIRDQSVQRVTPVLEGTLPVRFEPLNKNMLRKHSYFTTWIEPQQTLVTFPR